MSYLALARKWRPRTFLQLVGQEHINKALIKSLNQQRLHHAYLFTGTRGVGKTSVARLMAKALNCEKEVSANPCLECDACLAIEQNRFLDLIEIDGASKTRVEDTRELLENIQYSPTSGRYKIYLIDEVHMLSQHSFNALLKTLEEPPSHVKFLLATTDPQKLPLTVLSRCLQFNLKPLSVDIITSHLKVILHEEQYPFEEDAIYLLAKAARGSMRDALSLLDQAIASSEHNLRTDDVKAILGYTQQDYALQLLQALAVFDAPRLIKLNRHIAEEGGHFSYVLNELLNYLHQITVCQSLVNDKLMFESNAEIHELANQFKAEDVQLFYQIGINGTEEMHLAPTMLIGFEMTILRMLTFRPADNIAAPTLAYESHGINVANAPINALPLPAISDIILESSVIDKNSDTETELNCALSDSTLLSGDISAISSLDNIDDVQPTIENDLHCPHIELLPPSPIAQAQLPASKQSAQTERTFLAQPVIDEDWGVTLSQLKLTGLTQNAAENAEMVSKSGNEIVLRIAVGHRSLFTANVIQRIEQALTTYYHQAIKIKFDFKELVQSSPAQKKQLTQSLNQQEAEACMQEDPFLQQLKQEFSAELIKNSIELLKDAL